MLCVKLKDDKVRRYIVSYSKDFSSIQGSGGSITMKLLLPRVCGWSREMSPTQLHLHTFLRERDDNSVLSAEAADL